MKSFAIFIILSIVINIFGATMYIGPPGLQYILTPLVVLISSIFTFIAIYLKRKSDYHLTIFLLIFAITILTGTPIWLQSSWTSGHQMQMVGRMFYGVGIPTQIILLIVAVRRKND